MAANEELKQAYEALELPETATDAEIEKKYFMMLKKSKTAGGIDTTTINRAYNMIVEHRRRHAVEQFEEKNYGNSKLRKGWDHFWLHYKLHFVFGVVAVTILALVVQTVLDRRAERIAESLLPPVDLEVMIVGEFFQPGETDPGDGLLAHFPDWQRIKTLVSYNTGNPQDQFDIYASQKNLLNLMTERPDVYVTDRFNYELMVNQEAFLNLEPWKDEFPPERLVLGQSEKDDRPYIYAIDITGSPQFESSGLLQRSSDTFVSVRFDSERVEESLLFAKTMLGLSP